MPMQVTFVTPYLCIMFRVENFTIGHYFKQRACGLLSEAPFPVQSNFSLYASSCLCFPFVWYFRSFLLKKRTIHMLSICYSFLLCKTICGALSYFYIGIVSCKDYKCNVMYHHALIDGHSRSPYLKKS